MPRAADGAVYLGYLLPILPMALAQTLVCLLAASIDLPVWRILACTAVNVPIALAQIWRSGMLCGTLLPERPSVGCAEDCSQCLGVALRHLFLLDLGERFSAASPMPPGSPTPSTRHGLRWQGTGAAFPQLWITLGMGSPLTARHDLPQK